MRSNYYGEELDHLFTSRRRREPWETICSWCESVELPEARFRALNDRIWGSGGWIEYGVCLDSHGNPSFHHKEMHD